MLCLAWGGYFAEGRLFQVSPYLYEYKGERRRIPGEISAEGLNMQSKFKLFYYRVKAALHKFTISWFKCE